jgi:hypothetical protein
MFDSEEAKKRVNNSMIFIGGILFVTAVLLLIAVLVFFCACWYNWDNAAKLGQFGDFIGGTLNPTFSVASLILIGTSLYFTHLSLEIAIAANEFTMFSTQKQIESEIERHKQELIANETKSRRDLTIAWHKNWMSPEMATLKRSVFGDIENRIKNCEAGQHSAFIGGLRISDAVQVREKYHWIKDVMLLIHHAITFFDDELLDKDLFLKLLAADFRQWYSVLSKLDMRIGTFDTTQHSEAEDAERRELVERLARAIGI